MIVYKIKTEKGTYFDVISGDKILGTNKNGKKWYQQTCKSYFKHPKSIEIPFDKLPIYLQNDIKNFDISA